MMIPYDPCEQLKQKYDKYKKMESGNGSLNELDLDALNNTIKLVKEQYYKFYDQYQQHLSDKQQLLQQTREPMATTYSQQHQQNLNDHRVFCNRYYSNLEANKRGNIVRTLRMQHNYHQQNSIFV